MKGGNLGSRIADPLLISFLILFVALLLVFPGALVRSIDNFPLSTLIALIGLIIITTAIEESRYFSSASIKILRRIGDERKLALFFIGLSAGLASFLTNDIALFIVIPLTLSVQRRIENDLGKMIVFEAIAVNIGSSLTPIGNPQNLYIWHEYNIPFHIFVANMLIPVLLSLLVLLSFILITIPRRSIEIGDVGEERVNKRLLTLSILLLLPFILLLQFRFEYIALLMVMLILIPFPGIVKRVDWLLIIVFALIFTDFGAIPFLLPSFSISNGRDVYLLSALISQITSNVPATVMLSHGTEDWRALAWGVNIGGNGLLISSLANIIAMRLSRRKLIGVFHRYSVPFFLITLIALYLLL